ncbi:hypothetical protein F4778DRAFT_42269 [Xylariomycetidae sp. FL2044]|nr:hypothetical protein F4778DRAFT_42269 [Xylariomycetidae sp. FL2044]
MAEDVRKKSHDAVIFFGALWSTRTYKYVCTYAHVCTRMYGNTYITSPRMCWSFVSVDVDCWSVHGICRLRKPVCASGRGGKERKWRTRAKRVHGHHHHHHHHHHRRRCRHHHHQHHHHHHDHQQRSNTCLYCKIKPCTTTTTTTIDLPQASNMVFLCHILSFVVLWREF